MVSVTNHLLMIRRSNRFPKAKLFCGRVDRLLTRSRFFTTTSTRLFDETYNVIYDSKCALCRMEIDWLKRKNTDGKLLFTDLESAYDQEDPRNAGVSYRDGMEAMTIVHGETGKIQRGIEVFPAIYDTLGLGWVWAFTKLPIVGPISADVYTFWAKYRTNVTRGKSIDSLVDEYLEYQSVKECNDECKSGHY